jgi:hypothetical protein
MRISKVLLSLSLALILVLAAAAPAIAAEKIQVQIQNKTGESVRLSLSGPASYSFNLTTGKNKVEVTPGKYSYSYKACGGQTLTGKFNAKKAGATLTLPKCKQGGSGGIKEAKVTIKNLTGGAISIYLSGPQSYVFNFGTGISKMSVVPGKYSYTVYGCGTSMSGTMNFKGSGRVWTFWCG